jgi:hypothetical protein
VHFDDFPGHVSAQLTRPEIDRLNRCRLAGNEGAVLGALARARRRPERAAALAEATPELVAGELDIRVARLCERMPALPLTAPDSRYVLDLHVHWVDDRKVDFE